MFLEDSLYGNVLFLLHPRAGFGDGENVEKSKEREKIKKAWLLAPTHARRPENQVEPSCVESLKASL